MHLVCSRRLPGGTPRIAPKNGKEITLSFAELWGRVLQVMFCVIVVGICTHDGRFVVGVTGDGVSATEGKLDQRCGRSDKM